MLLLCWFLLFLAWFGVVAAVFMAQRKYNSDMKYLAKRSDELKKRGF